MKNARLSAPVWGTESGRSPLGVDAVRGWALTTPASLSVYVLRL